MSKRFIITLSALICAMCCIVQTASAYEDNEFPGKGSYQDWLRTAPIFHDGNKLRRDGKYAEAIVKFKQTLTIYPYNPGAWSNIGWCYEKLNNLKEAETATRKSLGMNQSDWSTWEILANILYDEHKYDESKQDFLEVLKRNPPQAKATEIHTAIVNTLDPLLKVNKQ